MHTRTHINLIEDNKNIKVKLLFFSFLTFQKSCVAVDTYSTSDDDSRRATTTTK